MNTLASLIAQDQAPVSKTNPMTFMFPLLIAMVVFMFLSSRSQKKREKREREEMFARMAKSDRVVTVGGVIGTVISTKGDEVILKIDESTNTKMTVLKTAIQRILVDDALAGGEKR